MRFEPLKWHEVPSDEEFQIEGSLLHVMCDKSAAVYVSQLGVEALAGVGTEVRVSVAPGCSARIVTEGRAFLYRPPSSVVRSAGEVFSNADRMVIESGTVREVAQAMREFQLMRSSALREMRQLERERKSASSARVERAPEPEESPDDAADPEGEPSDE